MQVNALQVALLALCVSSAQTELLVNSDFEAPLGQEWFCSKCTLDRSLDAYRGDYSIRVSDRFATWDNIVQIVQATPGEIYAVSALVKVENLPSGSSFAEFCLKFRYTLEDGSKKTTTEAVLPRLVVADGWQNISAVFQVPNTAIVETRLYFEANSKEVNYLLDDVSMSQVAASSNWRTAADDSIEQLRRNDIHLDVHVSGEYDVNLVDVSLELVRHEFGFGSSVNENYMSGGQDAIYDLYINYFVGMFWAGMPEWSMDWRKQEPQMDVLDMERADACVEDLQSYNIAPHGSSIVKANPSQLPSWASNLSGQSLQARLDKRIQDMAAHYADSIEHLVVNDESLHYTGLEEVTGDYDITAHLFQSAHAAMPDVKLFLSEDDVLIKGEYTQAIVNQAKALMAQGIAVDGIAAQFSLGADDSVNPTILTKQLDTLGALGLPVWVTQLTVDRVDVTERAEAYTDLLRLFYSHPAVHGVMLYGFFDRVKCGKNAALVETEGFVENAAGKAVRDLWRSWATNMAIKPDTHALKRHSTRGYHGDYIVKIMYDGKMVKEQSFTLDGNDVTMEVHVVPQGELIRNGDIEVGLTGGIWKCPACDVTASTDAYQGLYSLYIHNRTTSLSNVAQKVKLLKAARYYVSAMVKMSATMGPDFQTSVSIQIHLLNANSETTLVTVAKIPNLMAELGWQEIGAAFVTPDTGSSSSMLVFDVDDVGVSYRIDEVSLRDMSPELDWKQAANRRIEEFRKSDVTFRVRVAPEYDPTKVQFRMRLTQHAFAYGATVPEEYIRGSDDQYASFKRYFYRNFWWATPTEAFGWPQMEPSIRVVNYTASDEVLNKLTEQRVSMLGRSVVWDAPRQYPAWLNLLGPSQVRRFINRRVTRTVGRYQGRIPAVVVHNNPLHGDELQQKSGNANLVESVLNKARSLTTDMQLIINERETLSSGTITQALVNTAKRLIREDDSTVALGVQGVFSSGATADIHVIKKRLDMLSRAGIPIWVTELAVNMADEGEAAELYEDIVRLLFSEPSVAGIILHGFTDDTDPLSKAALVRGEDAEETEAGRRLRSLWQNEWVSEEQFSPTQNSPHDVVQRGFRGRYNVDVLYDGQVLRTDEFDLNEDARDTILLNVVNPAEIMRDGDLENANRNGVWYCTGCTLKVIGTDCFDQYCARVTDSTRSWSSLRQDVALTSSRIYTLSAKIKVYRTPEEGFYSAAEVQLRLYYDSGYKTFDIARLPFMRPGDGWQTIKTAFRTGNTGFTRAVIMLRVSDASVDYVIDDVQLREKDTSVSWEEMAEQRIEEHRKGDLNLHIKVSPEYKPEDIQIEVAQKRPMFGYGSYINPDTFLGQSPSDSRYRKYFTENFRWAVPSGIIDWEKLEPTRGNNQMPEVLEILKQLQAARTQLYGTNVLSSLSAQMPSWLDRLSTYRTRYELTDHTEDFMQTIAPIFSNVEFVSDIVHGSFIEDVSRRTEMIPNLLKLAQSVENSTGLFIGDSDCLVDGRLTQAMVGYVEKLRSLKADPSGISLGLFYDSTDDIDLDLISERLEIVSEAELPIWITGLKVNRERQEDRAEAYEDLMRLLYSHRRVAGVIMAGYWGHETGADSSLVDGDMLQENLAGLRLRELWETTWNTSIRIVPQSNALEKHSLRGFLGDYDVIVRHKDDVISELSLTLTRESDPINIDVYPSNEMVTNGDFESVQTVAADWECVRCKLQVSKLSYSGVYSAYISDRTKEWSSPQQSVPLVTGGKYTMSAMIRLHERTRNANLIKMRLYLQNSRDERIGTVAPAILPRVAASEGWTQIAAVFVVNEPDVSLGILHFNIDDPETNFYVDEVKLREITQNSNWKMDASNRILDIRKNDIQFRVRVSEDYDANNVTIKIKLTKPLFGYGAPANEHLMTSQSAAAVVYQNYFFDNFWWGAHEYSFLWSNMEQDEGSTNFERVEATMDFMVKNNVNMRASNLLWADPRRWPTWLSQRAPSQVRGRVARRVRSILQRFLGSFAHVDVNHGAIQYNDFEEKSKRVNFTADIFRNYHEQDPSTVLFIEDNDVLSSGYYTQAMINTIKQWQKAGVPVQAIGVEGHFDAEFDPDVIQHRLDMLATTGLPVWITQFDVHVGDSDRRASVYDDLITLFHSSPAVAGVILNGFYSEVRCDEHSSLVDGSDFIENAAGRRLRHLWHDTWHSEAVHMPTANHIQEFTMSGFHGEYDVSMYYNGELTKKESLVVEPGEDMVVDINMRDRAELIRNGDFETDVISSEWTGVACMISRSLHSYAGLYSLYIYNRGASYASAQQVIPVVRRGQYHISAMAKIESLAGDAMYHRLLLKIKLKLVSGTTKYMSVSNVPFMRPSIGWQKIGGAFVVEDYESDILEATLAFDLEPDINYYLDEVRLREIQPDEDWRTAANQRIDQVRKSNVNISMKVSEEYQLDNVRIVVNLTRSNFGFGTNARARYITGSNRDRDCYRQYFYDSFWYAAPERALRWDFMESQEGLLDYDELNAFVTLMDDKRIPLLAPGVVWGKSGKYPSWLDSKTPSQTKVSLDGRLVDIMEKFGGRFSQLDIYKESLHFDQIETLSNDPDVMAAMVTRVRELDPDIKLFLNDYDVFADGTFTQAIVGLAQLIGQQSSSLDSIGVEARFVDGVDDIALLAKRLEILEEASLPIWVTELLIDEGTSLESANAYEDVLRLLFSTKLVAGILLYDFSDLARASSTNALVTGTNCQETEVGKRINKLWKEEWNSQFTLFPSSHSQQDLSFRLFHGDYDVFMYHDGEMINTQSFTVTPESDAQVISLAVIPAEESITDGDFEGGAVPEAWSCAYCSLSLSQDAFKGSYSAYISNRQRSNSYIEQVVSVKATGKYHLSAHVKLENLPVDEMYVPLYVKLRAKSADGSTSTEIVSTLPYMTPEQGWTEVATAFSVDYPDAVSLSLSLETPDSQVNYRIDEVRLREIATDPAWKSQAQQRIDDIRKNNIHLRMSVSEDFDVNKVEVEVKLKKHAFGYGSVADAKDIGLDRSTHVQFKNYFLNNFWWATFHKDFTWRKMESTRDIFTESFLVDALDVLEQHDINVLGRGLATSLRSELPLWLPDLAGIDIMEELEERLTHLANTIGPRFDQLDFNDGQLHSAFYETAAGSVNASAWILEYASDLIPQASFFLNDDEILSEPSMTQAMVNFAKLLIRYGLDLGGIGVEANFKASDGFDPDLLLRRLEILEAAGIPVWIREFSVEADDVTQRAALYDDLLTLFLSAPAVQGVFLKGIWDQERVTSLQSLVDGDDFLENEAGRRVRSLWEDSWTTRTTIQPERNTLTTYDVVGFYGDYDVIMRHDGEVVKTQSFTLTQGQGIDLYFDIYPQNEMIRNPGFEAPIEDSDVECLSCNIEYVLNPFKGNYAAFVTGRTALWNTVAPWVTARSGGRYYTSLMMKLANDVAGFPHHELLLNIRVNDIVNGEDVVSYKFIGSVPYATAAKGWIKVAGTFDLDDVVAADVRISPIVYVESPDINFYVDEYRMREIEQPENWRDLANERIQKHRTSPLVIEVDISNEYQPDLVRVEVILRRHSFPYGSAVTANTIRSNNPASQNYRDYFYDNFWYAVFANAFKWHLLEKKRNFFNWARVDEALDALDAHNISTRGHCMFWGNGEINIPYWLESYGAESVKSEIDRRITQAASRYKGRFTQYDVNNEQIHGYWYENHTQDIDITPKMFEKIHAIDPDVQLFTNDYNVLSMGIVTQAAVNQVLEYKKKGIPIGGLGAQSHFRTTISVDPILVYERLEMLAEAGVPIWVTELDINMEDRTECPQAYADLMRMMFSHPSVEGMIMWGFTDVDHLFPYCSHVTGDNLELTDSGKTIQNLWKEEWNTHEVITPTSRNPDPVTLNAFHGTYDIHVYYDDMSIMNETFELSKGVTEHKTIRI